MLRFKSLGSGSTGNATVVETVGTRPFRLLVDCGLGLKHLQLRLTQAGLSARDIGAVFVTHEHGDHIGCARALSLKYQIPVWMSRGTYLGIGEPDFAGNLHIARDGEAICLDGLQLMPFTVPHDAREPLQLSCTDGSAKLGILTDLGHATTHVLSHLSGCDGLMLECNHDLDMLEKSAYPVFLKRRVGGPYGHLSNVAAADIARSLRHAGLKHFVAAHLSRQNNQVLLVQDLLAQALSCCPDDIVVAGPDEGTRWLQI